MAASSCNLSLRFLHNVKNAPNVDIYVDGVAFCLNLAYSETTIYLSAPHTSFTLSVRVAGTQTQIAKAKLRLGASQSYLVMIAGLIVDPSTISLTIYQDRTRCPQPGSSRFRFIHGAAGAPGVDVYVNGVKTFSNVTYKSTGEPSYVGIPLGLTSVSVNLAGTSTVVIPAKEYYIVSGGIYTAVASGLVSDGLSLVFTEDNSGHCEQLQKAFNVQKYSGLWYQIANIPSFFDLKCQRSSATYTPVVDDEGGPVVKVFNVCYDANWNVIETITGVALPSCNPAALTVEFPTPIPVVIQGPNYLVHETDYVDYSMVGSPTRTNFFILARTKSISRKLYDKLLAQAVALGYDASKIVINPGAVTKSKPDHHCGCK